MLRRAIRKHSALTPRQIRIFYYRYVLTKDILKIEYDRINRQNTWGNPAQSKIMVELLLEYSKPGRRQQLSNHKSVVLNEVKSTIKAELIDNTVLGTEDYCQLLRAFDIVIAY